MKFIDEAIITVQSGDGGAGCVSFRREKFIPRGGPDGGDGGDGGNVIFKSTSQKRTLYDFRYKHIFKASNGGYGQGRQKTGCKGKDLIIEVPPGTVISDAESGEIVKDFIGSGETYIVAKGGRGGQGNRRFATSVRRAPRFAQPGEPGQSLSLKLELKLLADVGLIGFPNAGKSTLISVISSARPKIGDYPFTTLTPNMGVVKTGEGEPFTVADIPGLIENAHQGAGLGIRFLKHIERTRLLVHMIDVTTIGLENPLESYLTINRELASYNAELTQKEQIIVINKMDLSDSDAAAERFQKALPDREVLLISAATTKGVKRLLDRLIQRLDQFNE